MKPLFIFLGFISLFVLIMGSPALAQDPGDPGYPDTLYFSCGSDSSSNGDTLYISGSDTHDVRIRINFWNDSMITAISVPLVDQCFTPTSSAYLDTIKNNKDSSYIGSRVSGWQILSVHIKNSLHQVLYAPLAFLAPPVGPGNGLLATMVYTVRDTGRICLDTLFFPPANILTFVDTLAVGYTPIFRPDTFIIAYVEGWEILAGDNVSGLSNSQVTAKFYIQNTGLAPDSCSLTVSDSLGWDIQPPDYKLTLDSGQQDSVFFNISIPSVPVGTVDRITLNGGSLTNPFVIDSASLLITCESYNVTITNISDVGNDQGKQVSIEWTSFPGSDPLATDFSVFRRKDSLLTFSADTLTVIPDISFAYPPGEWDWLVTLPAFGETLYSVVVPTLKDSTISEGMYWSVFFIRAGTDTPTVYFDSPIDSGYSVNNLSPSPPTGLLAFHKPAVTQLTWTKCGDIDFDYYTLYRDTTSEFESSPDNRLGYTIDTIFTDSTAQLGKEYYYLVSATDFSGNESSPSNEAMGVRYITGDANANGEIDIIDIVHLINYLFRNGPPPTPLEAGNVNCEDEVSVSDVVYLINYVLKGGPPPCEPDE